MRSVLGIIVAGSMLVGAVPSGRLVAQASDQWVGTWKLNAAKSKFSPAPGPKSITVTISKAGAGLKFSATTVGADGQSSSTDFTTMLDGKDVAVTGATDYDMVSVKMLDPMTRHMVRKKGGKEVQTVHSVLAKDGKHYTSTTTGTNAKGQKVSSTIVFDKQ
jgi:hypothetical protein